MRSVCNDDAGCGKTVGEVIAFEGPRAAGGSLQCLTRALPGGAAAANEAE